MGILQFISIPGSMIALARIFEVDTNPTYENENENANVVCTY
jgi:hypothetical protein